MPFRFENLDTWKRSVALALRLFGIADRATEAKQFRFGEQLRSAALSISNNIAEGSGCASNKEFRRFLDIARRSVFECANMVIIFNMQTFVSANEKTELARELDELCRMITAFSRSLRD